MSVSYCDIRVSERERVQSLVESRWTESVDQAAGFIPPAMILETGQLSSAYLISSPGPDSTVPPPRRSQTTTQYWTMDTFILSN